jgi:hypothetical protein
MPRRKPAPRRNSHDSFYSGVILVGEECSGSPTTLDKLPSLRWFSRLDPPL